MQSSTSSEDEAELNVSSNEVQDLQREAKEFFCDDSNQVPTIFPIDEVGKIDGYIGDNIWRMKIQDYTISLLCKL